MKKTRSDVLFDDAWVQEILDGALGKIDRALSEEEVGELLKDVVLNALPETGTSLLKQLRREWRSQRRFERRTQRSFERNLQNTWGEGLDRLRMLMAMARELGELVNERYRPSAAEQRDARFEALTRLHARACQVAYEILVLLDSGLASGAHARWRALHEIAIVCQFVADHDQETAERYLLHDRATAWAAAEEYQRHATTLGEDAIAPDAMQRMMAEREELRTRFGPCYHRENGWALASLRRACPAEHWSHSTCRVSIAELERAVDLEHWRPQYRMASHAIHAGPRGIHWNLEIGETTTMLIAGPVDHGLADPASNTALSLLQVTAPIVLLRPSFMLLTGLQALTELAGEVQSELMKSHRLGERRAAANSRLWRWQDWVLGRRPR